MIQTINTNAKISFEQAKADIEMNKEAKCKAAKDNRLYTQGSMMTVNIGLLGGGNRIFNGGCAVSLNFMFLLCLRFYFQLEILAFYYQQIIDSRDTGKY